MALMKVKTRHVVDFGSFPFPGDLMDHYAERDVDNGSVHSVSHLMKYVGTDISMGLNKKAINDIIYASDFKMTEENLYIEFSY